jgi:hypothetical protein
MLSYYTVSDFAEIDSRGPRLELDAGVQSVLEVLSAAVAAYAQEASLDAAPARDGGFGDARGGGRGFARSDSKTDFARSGEARGGGHRRSSGTGERGGARPRSRTQEQDKQEKDSETWATQPKFKSTKLDMPKEGVDKNITFIRSALNKISGKTYDVQRAAIFESMTEFAESEDAADGMRKIALAVFEVASNNKFFSELYAQLYGSFVNTFPVFLVVLDDFVMSYKSTIENIVYINPDVDYDGFCVYTKSNDRRKATASFIIMLMNSDVLESARVADIVTHFQQVFETNIEIVGKTDEIDEIAETVFVFLSLGKQRLGALPCWLESIIPSVERVSKMKVADHASLTQRSVFKFMDIVAAIKKV